MIHRSVSSASAGAPSAGGAGIQSGRLVWRSRSTGSAKARSRSLRRTENTFEWLACVADWCFIWLVEHQAMFGNFSF